jgi:hypothetical protein
MRRRAVEKVCANPRIWTGPTPKRPIRGDAENLSIHSWEGVASPCRSGVDRMRVCGDGQRLPQKNRIKRGVFERNVFRVPKQAYLHRRHARKRLVLMAAEPPGRDRKYFCKTVDTSKKRD